MQFCLRDDDLHSEFMLLCQIFESPCVSPEKVTLLCNPRGGQVGGCTSSRVREMSKFGNASVSSMHLVGVVRCTSNRSGNYGSEQRPRLATGQEKLLGVYSERKVRFHFY